jgi:hypothetical protein
LDGAFRPCVPQPQALIQRKDVASFLGHSAGRGLVKIWSPIVGVF